MTEHINDDHIVDVVSFSGGRTSGRLVYLMEQRRAKGNIVKYVFLDTGAEHPKTYQFIKNISKYWGIEIICLRVVVNSELGKPNSYKEISIDDIGPDLGPWKDICDKYGTPYIHGPFCTRTMKLEPFQRYCKEHFKNYHTWLGIRVDEPKRLKVKEGISYFADICDMEKVDILNWWKQQSFDLDLPEHLGNCVFCIKKGVNKIALATRDEPEMAEKFRSVIESNSVRVVDRRQQENKIMYRDNNSLEGIIAMYSDISREEIASTIRGTGGYESGSCSESCEVLLADDVEPPEVISQSPYCAALNTLREQPTHKLKQIGDQWRTPDPLWWGINSIFGPFVLDLFADESNAKCEAYYSAEDNALSQNWSERLAELNGAAYANPPYSRASQHDGQYITGMRQIMAHTLAMRESGGRYVFLIKAATGEVWWPEDADHIAFIRGRISFDLPVWYRPEEGQPTESSAGFGAAVAVFDKSWRGPKFDYISRDQLEARGAAFMAQIERAAQRLAPRSIPIPIPESENDVWPVEVQLLAVQLPGLKSLATEHQRKVMHHMNRMLLERQPSTEIIAAAQSLTATFGEQTL
ncbi:phage N-6-adenine-methyltransferase [Pantoea sp. AMG 501]|nr:phage N-6-adenine-methyltransferase [Pantoea sp. AMG 501]